MIHHPERRQHFFDLGRQFFTGDGDFQILRRLIHQNLYLQCSAALPPKLYIMIRLHCPDVNSRRRVMPLWKHKLPLFPLAAAAAAAQQLEMCKKQESRIRFNGSVPPCFYLIILLSEI
ncbi:MAG: hypothetical protein HDT27_07235 [Subdoligranulum sp.]|nr:hypothetical protein [Subdoligranulum sp.]